MKKKIVRLIGIISMVIFPCIASAADNISIAVSCSIPAVPGLNAPLNGEQPMLVKTATPPENQNIAAGQTQKQDESPATLQEDGRGQIVLANGKTADVLMQTVYSR